MEHESRTHNAESEAAEDTASTTQLQRMPSLLIPVSNHLKIMSSCHTTDKAKAHQWLKIRGRLLNRTSATSMGFLVMSGTSIAAGGNPSHPKSITEPNDLHAPDKTPQ